MRAVGPVRTRLELRLVLPGGTSLPVVAVLGYDPADPWAVRVSFQTGGEGDGVVEWLFARQLLTDGVSANTGAGDVRVWPGIGARSSIVHLAMTSPSGSALFELERRDLLSFLDQTYQAVQDGTEDLVIDLDAELAELLSS